MSTASIEMGMHEFNKYTLKSLAISTRYILQLLELLGLQY